MDKGMTAEFRKKYLWLMGAAVEALQDPDEAFVAAAKRLGISPIDAEDCLPSNEKTLIGKLIAADVTKQMRNGLNAENAVIHALKRFQVVAPPATFRNMVSMFEKDQNRIAGLNRSAGEVDNGAGGTMRITNKDGKPYDISELSGKGKRTKAGYFYPEKVKS